MKRPIPTNYEIKLDPKKYIVSKTDRMGFIEYGNKYFIEICGYSDVELIGKPHNIIRHPDMPKVVFKLMWQRIKAKQNIMAVVKNMAKNGDHYWVFTDFESRKDSKTKEILSYMAYRKAAPKRAVEAIIPIYKKLLIIENEAGVEASEKYLNGYLEEKRMTYDEFIQNITGYNGVFKVFFIAMKKIFG